MHVPYLHMVIVLTCKTSRENWSSPARSVEISSIPQLAYKSTQRSSTTYQCRTTRTPWPAESLPCFVIVIVINSENYLCLVII